MYPFLRVSVFPSVRMSGWTAEGLSPQTNGSLSLSGVWGVAPKSKDYKKRNHGNLTLLPRSDCRQAFCHQDDLFVPPWNFHS